MMLSLKQVTRSRTLLSSILTPYHPFFVPIAASLTCSFSSSYSYSNSSDPASESPYQYPSYFNGINFHPSADIAYSFKRWFESGNKELLDRIYEILNDRENGSTTDLALSQLGLRLNEDFVLEVLAYGSNVLSCLKFFDWAGRQPGYNHTRATFTAIFKILRKAKLMSVMFDFLETFEKQKFAHIVRFHETLVIGYAVAGKPEIALNLLGKMRFQGLDLDSFGYHILLNSLVEKNCFDAFQMILEQIQLRGHDNRITHSLIMKNLCKQRRFDEAEEYLNGMVSNGEVLHGAEVNVLVNALCENKMFERARKLVAEFSNLGLVNVNGMWVRDLVRAGRLDEALEFLQQKIYFEGYIPSPFPYNLLIGKLLGKDRLREVYDLLMEMKDSHIPPDKVTMNTVLCFFCKAGLVEVALELFYSRSQFGLSPNYYAYKCLIHTLCRTGSVDEAYIVLKQCISQGYYIDRGTFSAVANSLCKDCKINEMEQLLFLSLERNFAPCSSTYDKLILALCQAGRLADGYLLHCKLNNTSRRSYIKLILGFCKFNRGDIAARLLIEMQENGYIPTPPLYRAVIYSLLERDTTQSQSLDLLEMLSHYGKNAFTWSTFIKVAVYAKKPDLARKVFEIVRRNDAEPTVNSCAYMLKSYLTSKRISDALNFFRDLQGQGLKSRKLYNFFIIGLCKVEKADMALELLSEMRNAKLTPSVSCYEVLIQVLCNMRRYPEAISLVNDYEKMGRRLTSYIGNILLLHSLRAPELYDVSVHLRGVKEEVFSGSSILSLVIGVFSRRLRVNHHTENLEELIEMCFPLSRYTYNLLLMRASKFDIDQACELFNSMCKKGYKPNQYTFNIVLHGFFMHGRSAEGKLWFEETLRSGFYPISSKRHLTDELY
ncbi:pentatricopeptide repeat-containing protein [Senna tora]|uniref:Pentatricopeptide repeat-containing protein n=1 Tax=Senna tora TaxID=362788 RepID=A0A834WDS2_9FABA|nr:pentatricopeptide repeat-containing protein [Senna tora]